MLKSVLFVVALSVSALGLCQIDPARVIAVVNGDEIKAAEYYRYMEYMDLKEPYSRFRNMIFSFPAGFLALDQLMTQRMMNQLAKARNAVPSEPEVNAELQNYLADFPETVKDWKDKGRTDAELRDRVRFDLLSFKLQTQGITVTDLEVEKHYKDNLASFTTPKLYKLRVIVATDAGTRDKVDAELKAGKAFAEVARQYSDDISRVNGGEYGSVALTTLPEPIAKAIQAARIGESTGWVEFQKNSVRFFLEDVTPEKVSQLDAKLKRTIRKNLMLTSGRVKIDLGKLLGEFRLKSKVDIKQKDFASIYAKLMEVQGTAKTGSGG